MVFTSWEFVGFFALVLVVLRLMPTRTSRQAAIFVASAVFYGANRASYLLILAAPSLIDFACAVRIEETADPQRRRQWLTLSIVSNLGLLGYFKYADFLADSVGALLGVHTAPSGILLPIGISFFTFKTLSYTIDVYRREIPACRSLWRYAMFVSYFPELVAGPIVRASVFLPQLERRLEPSWARASIGLQAILLGVSKKLLVADRLAAFVDPVFHYPQAYSAGTVASAVVAYSLQIYCDFSGYSDMAIGISRIIGFDLPENFDMPYIATSVTEFWRRWHITLSEWLRDYLYIPLGGNRKGAARRYVNLMVTMLLGGLWHGASWTFVFWGFLHGVGLAAHKIWRRHGPAEGLGALGPAGTALAWAMTYGFTCVAWVFFRASDFPTAVTILRKLTGAAAGGARWHYLPLVELLPLVVVAHVIGIAVERAGRQQASEGDVAAPAPIAPLYREARRPFAVRPHPAAGRYVLLPLPGAVGAFLLSIWLAAIFLFSPLHTQPFIYFKF